MRYFHTGTGYQQGNQQTKKHKYVILPCDGQRGTPSLMKTFMARPLPTPPLDCDESPLIAVSRLGLHTAPPPARHPPLPVELGVAAEAWNRERVPVSTPTWPYSCSHVPVLRHLPLPRARPNTGNRSRENPQMSFFLRLKYQACI